jgi:hypothetical protein
MSTVEKARITIDEIAHLEVFSDPSILPGAGAEVGSMAYLYNGARKWQKSGPLDTDWKEDNVAKNVSFDPKTSGLLSTDVEEAILELNTKSNISASPGFTWGRSGNLPPGTWLLNDTVPSNVSGRTVFLHNAFVQNIYIANEYPTAGIVLGIYSHDGGEINLLQLGTVTTIASRSNSFAVSYSVAMGKQLAIKIESGSAAKNLDCGILMKGTTT